MYVSRTLFCSIKYHNRLIWFRVFGPDALSSISIYQSDEPDIDNAHFGSTKREYFALLFASGRMLRCGVIRNG